MSLVLCNSPVSSSLSLVLSHPLSATDSDKYVDVKVHNQHNVIRFFEDGVHRGTFDTSGIYDEDCR